MTQTATRVMSVGVAVVGLGVGEQHALAYQRRGCAVRWVYDLDASRMRDVLARLGQGAAASSFDAILADPSVDVVSIATFDDAHFEQIIAALDAGKHVFVEKPLCRSEDELHGVVAAWRRTGRQLHSNLVLRAAPLYRWLRDAVTSGQLGTVYAFDGDYLYGRLHKITEGWRKDVDDYSVMQGGGIHLVDLMLWLTGERPERVSAVGGDVATRGSAFRYHDFAAATFRFRSGLVGRITANFGCVHRHHHVVRVFGTRGTFVYDDRGARLHTSRDPGAAAQSIDLSALPATKGDLIPSFVDSVVHGADPAAAARHEFDVVRACLAADRAVKSGASERLTTSECYHDQTG